jgi:hypothetical protein
MANCAQQLIMILDGKRPPRRIAIRKVRPAYAKRLEHTFGFSAGGGRWTSFASEFQVVVKAVREMSTWQLCALSDARAGIKMIKQHNCLTLLRIQPSDLAFILSKGRNKANIPARSGVVRDIRVFGREGAVPCRYRPLFCF